MALPSNISPPLDRNHGQSFGSLVMIDQNIADDGRMSQVTRITPDAQFPEAETDNHAYQYGTARVFLYWQSRVHYVHAPGITDVAGPVRRPRVTHG